MGGRGLQRYGGKGKEPVGVQVSYEGFVMGGRGRQRYGGKGRVPVYVEVRMRGL